MQTFASYEILHADKRFNDFFPFSSRVYWKLVQDLQCYVSDAAIADENGETSKKKCIRKFSQQEVIYLMK